MKTIDNIIVYGDPIDEGAMSQIRTTLKTAARACMMADHHKGYAVPIGGVVAYKGAASPSGVGYDIGCGNKAVKLNVIAGDIDVPKILDETWGVLSFGIGLQNAETVEHELYEDPLWRESEFLRAKGGKMLQLARGQLGTIGSGNHYVDIFEDEDGFVWVGVHFGSRGFGHKTATHFLKQAGAKDGMDVEPCVLPLDSDLGEQYWKHMELAGRYAYAGRDWVCERVAKIIGGDVVDEVHNHHNFAWKEQHFGEEYVVVRKGATPAFPGQRGFVGGSMGDDSVIVEGVESTESEDIMYSTIHGAGRVMSRTRAAGKMDYRTRTRKGGEVTEEMMREWIGKKGVHLRGGGCDESPHCYKRLDEVLEHHKSTIRVTHRLRPLGVMMAGGNEFDPYRD
ncbi:MAG: RtcB family protein [Armatimonadetes bacterium]|nr:RtcB family protein [Armatimonadota bacterium]